MLTTGSLTKSEFLHVCLPENFPNFAEHLILKTPLDEKSEKQATRPIIGCPFALVRVTLTPNLNPNLVRALRSIRLNIIPLFWIFCWRSLRQTYISKVPEENYKFDLFTAITILFSCPEVFLKAPKDVSLFLSQKDHLLPFLIDFIENWHFSDPMQSFATRSCKA